MDEECLAGFGRIGSNCNIFRINDAKEMCIKGITLLAALIIAYFGKIAMILNC